MKMSRNNKKIPKSAALNLNFSIVAWLPDKYKQPETGSGGDGLEMAKFRVCKNRNNWNTRNNSANIAAVLHPKNYATENCRYSKHNYCYCNDSPIRPTLFSRPKSDFSDNNYDVTFPIELTSKKCHYQHDSDNNTRSDSYDFSNKGNFSEETTIDDTNTANVNDKKIDLNDFRKNHYFETHSVDDLTESVPAHSCVHRFGLDSRSLPEPLNADVFGVSRCVICGKPMDNPKSSGGVDERTTKTKGVLPKFYKYGLAPKRIHIGNGDVKIEVVAKLGDLVEIGEKPEYFNTYALRYQKGVSWP